MQIGSTQHKAQFIQDLTKTYQENIWKEDLALLDFKDRLGTLRKEKAELDLKLEQKEFKSASEGKKLIEQTQSQIEALQAAIQGKNADKAFWISRIELIQRYQESA